MMRIKLFGLFIAFALLALFKPRKCIEMLDAADNWVRYCHSKRVRERMDMLVQRSQ